jgi:hypothetical protein
MKFDLQRFLHEHSEWLTAVESIQSSFAPACRHLKGQIALDLECIENGRPFAGILKGFETSSPGSVEEPEADPLSDPFDS